MADAAATAHLFEHVQDAYYFEVPRFLANEGKLLIPQPFGELRATGHGYEHVSGFLITKFMVLEVVAAVLVAVIFITLAGKISRGGSPRGRFWNFFEALLLLIRDDVAKPTIGSHDAHKFLPYLWTLFFFVLFCNLLGMLPWSGSPTGALAVTGAMAICTFSVVVGAGMYKLGAAGFWKAQVPHMDLPGPLALIMTPLIFAIEVFGLFVKHFVLSVRLLANMFAGHLVLAVIVGFIAQSASSNLWYGIMPASVLGAVALSLLELFVAFLQAYILTFLSSLFIGMAVHPH